MPKSALALKTHLLKIELKLQVREIRTQTNNNFLQWCLFNFRLDDTYNWSEAFILSYNHEG